MDRAKLDRLIDLVTDYPEADPAGRIAITDEIIDLLGLGDQRAVEPETDKVWIAVDSASVQVTATAIAAWMDSAAPTAENNMMAGALVDAVWGMRPKAPEDRSAAEAVNRARQRLVDRVASNPDAKELPDFLSRMVAGGQMAYSAVEAKEVYQALKDKAQLVQAKLSRDAAEYAESIRGRLTEIRERLKVVRTLDSEDAKQEWIALRAEWDQLLAGGSHHADAQAANVALNAEIKALFSGYGQRFIDDMLAASPVSVEDANLWAAAQVVEPGALERIARYGYKRDQLRADMAEFYRLCGGRLASVKIENQPQRRANAGSIHGHQDSVIRVGTSFNKRVLFHEMAHHLEADPQLLMAAKAFLVKRRDDDKAHSLRKLTGNKSFGTDELAYKDSWFDAYVGKLYPDATEVFSMGMEAFYDPECAGWRASLDPEMMALQIGAMKERPHPAAVAIKNLRAGSVAAKREADAANAATFDQLVSEAAAFVELRDVPEPEHLAWYARHQSYGGPKAKYLGEWNGRCFYSSPTIRNRKTQRKGRGFLIVRMYSDNGINSYSVSGDDLELAKAEAWYAWATGYYLESNDSQQLNNAIVEYRKRLAEQEARNGS